MTQISNQEPKIVSLKKGARLELAISDVRYPNIGIAYVEGCNKEIRVKNVIIGQRVFVYIQKKRKDYLQAQLLEVLEKAPNEIIPDCEHFGSCGGCNFLNLSYEDELKMKRQQLIDLFSKRTDLSGFNFPILPSPEESFYRNKMEFTFGNEYLDGPMVLGLHKRGSKHDIVGLSGCQLCHPDFSMLAKKTLEFALNTGLSHYHRIKHTGAFRHLLIRRTTNTKEIMIALVVTSEIKNSCSFDERMWLEMLKELEREGKLEAKLSSVYIIINDSFGDTITPESIYLLHGKKTITEKLLNLSFEISPFSFFQTNSLGAEILYSNIRDIISNGEHKLAVDLYCGTGTIAQIVSPSAKKVLGVEIVDSAVEDAIKNTELNNISNCRYYCSPVADFLKNVSSGEIDEDLRGDVIILDPPREGVGEKALLPILEYKSPILIYISCKATSLAGELPLILSKGYRLTHIMAVDMFPRTANVEVIACFQLS